MFFNLLLLKISAILKPNDDIVYQCPGDGCSECLASDTYTCTRCKEEYGLAYGNCIKCRVTNCASCNMDSSKCDYCLYGYYKSEDGNTVECKKCPSECSECESPDKCTRCIYGYGLAKGNDPNKQTCQRCAIEYCTYCDEDFNKCTNWDENSGPVLDQDGNPTNKHELCNDRFSSYCSDDVSKEKCKSGYGKLLYNDGTPTGTCARCPQYCESCSEDSRICDKCYGYAGPVLDKNGNNTGKCQRCAGDCNSCQEDYTVCDSCSNYQDPVTHECKNCRVGHCSVCKKDINICEECSPGYTLVLINGKSAGNCTQCPEGCKSCDVNGVCDECIDYYGMVYDGDKSTGKCQKCPDYCRECSIVNNNNICTYCEYGTGLIFENGVSTGKCEPCRLHNCYDCNTNSATCYLRSNAEKLNDDIARYIYCSANCLECTSYEQCTKCGYGYILFEGKCVSPIPNCESSQYNPQICSQCMIGYGFELDIGGKRKGSCKECPENCYSCQKDSSFCNHCSEGYGFVLDDKNQNTGRCQKCGPYCQTCDADHRFCTNCVEGASFVFDDKGVYTGECKNIENCKYSNYEADSCDRCKDGFGLVTNDPKRAGQCERCETENCEKCTNDYKFCESCESLSHEEVNSTGFKTGRCIYNSKNCYSFDYGFCHMCEDGYGFEKTENKEMTGRCTKCSQNCEDCEFDSSKCKRCVDGYGLQYEKNGNVVTCGKCPANCKNCNYDPSSCRECINGYSLIKGICSKCAENCGSCSEANSCLECAEGSYKNENGKCAKCPTNCNSCRLESNGVVCNWCIDGYAVSNNECKKCPDNCIDCETIDICKECKKGYGFYNENGSRRICKKCPANCLNCESNAEICSACESRYYFDTDASSSTYHQCISLDDSEIGCEVDGCIKCVSGTYDKCEKCKPPLVVDSNQECSLPGGNSPVPPIPVPTNPVTPNPATPIISPTPEPVKVEIDYSKTNENGEVVIDTADKSKFQDLKDNQQHTIELDVNEVGKDSLKLFIDNENGIKPKFVIKEGFTELELRSEDKFDITPPLSTKVLTIKLDSTSQASVVDAKGEIKIANAGVGQKEVNLNSVQVSPSSVFTLVPETKVKINEVDLNGISGLIVKSQDKSNVEITSIKVQNNANTQISNVVITNTFLLGYSSSIQINGNVDLTKATLDFPSNTQKSGSKAMINGIINTVPSKIIINERNANKYLDSERLIVAESSQKFECDKWGKLIDDYKYECVEENNVHRLYIKESKGGLSGGAIAGIVIGCVVAVGLVVFLCVYFLVIKKRGKNSSAEDDIKNSNAI